MALKPYPTDEDLLNPEDERELDVSALAAMPSPEAPPVALPADPREEGLAKLAELVAARPPMQQGPGAAELQYLAENRPQAGWKNVLGAVGSAIAESTGSRGAIERFHGAQSMAEQRRLAGLEQARAIDMGNRPVDRGVAELALMGGLSPEAASRLTQGSPGLKMLYSGMGQLGARYDQMANQAQQKEADRAQREEIALLNEMGRNQRAEDTLASREKVAAMRKKPAGGAGGGGKPLSPEEANARRAAYLQLQGNATPEEVAAFIAGDTSKLAPEKAAKLGALDQILAGLPQKKRDAVLEDTLKREGRVPDAVEQATQIKQRDPNKRLEYKKEIDESHRMISDALAAWGSMSPSGKEALAQLSGDSWASGTLRDAKMSPQDMAKAGAIQALANRLIKETSGAAVSDSEWTRIAREMGIASKNFDVLKGTGGVDRWLNSARAAWGRNKKLVESEFGDLFPKKGGK